MPLYKRQQDIDEDVQDQLDKDATTTTTTDDKSTAVDDSGNWKKRYGDLRSYSQRQINELNAKIKALEDQNEKQSKQFTLPKSKEEVQEWATKYPDVYGMIKSMINIDLIEATETVNKKFQSLEEKEHEIRKREALNAIVAAHPDFYDLENDQTFQEWIVTKSKRTQDALFENDTDAQAAIEVLNLYKLESGQTRKKASTPNARDAAKEVRTQSTRVPAPRSGTGEYDFSESQIEAMTSREYEKNETAIEEARRSGRIYYDITGAAQ